MGDCVLLWNYSLGLVICFPNTDFMKVILNVKKKSLQIIHLRNEITKGLKMLCKYVRFRFNAGGLDTSSSHMSHLAILSPILVASGILPEMSISSP